MTIYYDCLAILLVTHKVKRKSLNDERSHCGPVDKSSFKQQICGNNVDVFHCKKKRAYPHNNIEFYSRVERESDNKRSMG